MGEFDGCWAEERPQQVKVLLRELITDQAFDGGWAEERPQQEKCC
jgi:hypothetical protein